MLLTIYLESSYFKYKKNLLVQLFNIEDFKFLSDLDLCVLDNLQVFVVHHDFALQVFDFSRDLVNPWRLVLLAWEQFNLLKQNFAALEYDVDLFIGKLMLHLYLNDNLGYFFEGFLLQVAHQDRRKSA